MCDKNPETSLLVISQKKKKKKKIQRHVWYTKCKLQQQWYSLLLEIKCVVMK